MLFVHINIQAFKNISLTFFNSASMISCGREFLRVIICFKPNYFLASILTLLPVKSTQQLRLCLALWSWIQRNFRMVFLQTSYYFVFQHDLYINIYTKKKHTTTHLCKQEKLEVFPESLVIYTQNRKKAQENDLAKLAVPSIHRT